MSLLEKEKEIEDEQKVVNLAVITGGRDSTGNWLYKLPAGSVFLCRPKTIKTFELQEYHVIFKAMNAVHLAQNQNASYTMWVDSAQFSDRMEKYEVLIEGD